MKTWIVAYLTGNGSQVYMKGVTTGSWTHHVHEARHFSMIELAEEQVDKLNAQRARVGAHANYSSAYVIECTYE